MDNSSTIRTGTALGVGWVKTKGVKRHVMLQRVHPVDSRKVEFDCGCAVSLGIRDKYF
ncbi:MAG: hypothetical protein AAGF55_08600 [Pseudomonadota bacterium]